jgi:hypothetical protein
MILLLAIVDIALLIHALRGMVLETRRLAGMADNFRRQHDIA